MSGEPKQASAKSGCDGSEPDRDRVTINDIARLSGVSKKTVSRVINDHPRVKAETRARVKRVMSDHDYAPNPQARALAFQQSFLIALAYDNPSPQYVVNMQRGVLDALERSDYQLVLHPVDRGHPDAVARLEYFVEQHRPAGIIMPPSVSEDERIIEMLRQRGCRYVRIASVELDDLPVLVRTHDALGAAQAARHLASLGHSRIAHIHGPKSFRSVHERLAGFKAGLSEFGLELDPVLTFEAGYTYESGVRAADDMFMRPNRPTAVFAGNDEMAMGVFASARKVGLSIPDDVSIVGYDDSPMAARVYPGLTSVRLPIREMGTEAAGALLRQISGAGAQENQSFQPELVIRESTQPLR